MRISLIVAASTDNAIGKANALLWTLPNDMKFFKNTTWGMPVAMGRNTFVALNSKPLPGRLNIVISRQEKLDLPEGVVLTHDIASAIEAARKWNAKEMFIIGGGEIYKQSMSLADRIYLTRVRANFPEADAHLEGFEPTEWILKDRQDFPTDEKHAYAYSFEVWEKK
jgi:dihydrofolate reductase